MKAYGGSGGIAPHILDLCTSWRWSALRPSRFTLRERAPGTQPPAGWAPEPNLTRWWREKFSAPVGTRTPDDPARSPVLTALKCIDLRKICNFFWDLILVEIWKNNMSTGWRFCRAFRLMEVEFSMNVHHHTYIFYMKHFSYVKNYKYGGDAKHWGCAWQIYKVFVTRHGYKCVIVQLVISSSFEPHHVYWCMHLKLKVFTSVWKCL